MCGAGGVRRMEEGGGDLGLWRGVIKVRGGGIKGLWREEGSREVSWWGGSRCNGWGGGVENEEGMGGKYKRRMDEVGC